MQRIFMKMRCMPGMEKEYVRRHKLLMYCEKINGGGVSQEEKQLFKETMKLHREAGIKNYSIFLIGSDLYAYFEAEDYKETLEIITKSETGQKWQKYMEGFLEQENGVPVMELCEKPVFFLE